MNRVMSYLQHFFTAKRKGHDVHSPFVYQLCEEVFYNENGFYDFGMLKEMRERLLKDNTTLKVNDFGAGSKSIHSDQRKVKDILRKGNSTQLQAELLYKLINYLKPSQVIELGTSIGMTTLYLCSADPTKKVYSLEGSSALLNFAKELLADHYIKNCELIEGNFDSTFPNLLERIPEGGLIYFDGNHTYEATLRYFNEALKKKNAHSVFIFDDIYWSEGMQKAWSEIKGHASVKVSIDTWYFGMVFFKEEIKEKIDLKLFI